MDPITLIVTALAAGAALGAQDTVSAMVKDAYAGLKALVKKRLGGRPGGELVLARHEQAPETWQAPLMAELAETGADSDRDLIAAAQALLDLVGGAEGRTGKYTVDVRGAQGVQIGDHNRQDNVFNAPAEAAEDRPIPALRRCTGGSQLPEASASRDQVFTSVAEQRSGATAVRVAGSDEMPPAASWPLGARGSYDAVTVAGLGRSVTALSGALNLVAFLIAEGRGCR